MPELKKGFPYMACYAGIAGPEDGVLELMQVIRRIVLQLKRTGYPVPASWATARPGTKPRNAPGPWGIQEYVDMPGMIVDRPSAASIFRPPISCRRRR
ncbi:MAG: hypothetical protein MZU79_06925 [Anaerotruncus sp.]|nr:hypothetical protein [Anaerotruncus sp.]